MESPVRKMLKKNDYARHKLLRKIKRQRKARVELESHAAEKELRKKLKMPKFGDGKPGEYVSVMYPEDEKTIWDYADLFADASEDIFDGIGIAGGLASGGMLATPLAPLAPVVYGVTNAPSAINNAYQAARGAYKLASNDPNANAVETAANTLSTILDVSGGHYLNKAVKKSIKNHAAAVAAEKAYKKAEKRASEAVFANIDDPITRRYGHIDSYVEKLRKIALLNYKKYADATVKAQGYNPPYIGTYTGAYGTMYPFATFAPALGTAVSRSGRFNTKKKK